MNSRCRTCLVVVPNRPDPLRDSQFTLHLRGPPSSAPLLYDLQWAPLTPTTSTTLQATHNDSDEDELLDGDESGNADDWLDVSDGAYNEGDNWWGTSKGLSIKWNAANNTIFNEAAQILRDN